MDITGWSVDDLSPEGFVAASAAAAATGIVPTVTFNIAAGVRFGYAGIVLYVFSALLGSTLSFLLARSRLRNFLKLKVLSGKYKETVENIERAMAKDNPLVTVALLRLSPVMPFSPVSFILGIINVPFVPFVVGTFIGLIPASFPYVHAGVLGSKTLGGTASSETWDPISIAMSLVGLIVTVLLTIKVSRMATKALEKAD
eukprot:g936.t1